MYTVKKERHDIRKRARAQLTLGQRAARGFSMFFANFFLILFSATCIFPVIWLIYSSFKSNAEFSADILALPGSLNLEHYIRILKNGEMLTYLINSLRTTLLSLVLILLFGFIVGYFLARFRFKGRKLIYNYFLLGVLIPIHAIIVPMYILFKQTHLSDSWITLIFPYVSFGLPIAVFLVESYIKSLPKEMEEAAAIDGSSFSRTLFTIILPMTAPILTAVGIIQFFTCWNEFIFSLILINDQNLMTIPVGLSRFKGQFSAEYPVMMTTMVIGMAPAMILYFCFSKQIIKGMVAGAVKG